MSYALVTTVNSKLLYDTVQQLNLTPGRPHIVQITPFIDARLQGNEHVKPELKKLAIIDDEDAVSDAEFGAFFTEAYNRKGRTAANLEALTADFVKRAERKSVKATIKAGVDEYAPKKATTGKVGGTGPTPEEIQALVDKGVAEKLAEIEAQKAAEEAAAGSEAGKPAGKKG